MNPAARPLGVAEMKRLALGLLVLMLAVLAVAIVLEDRHPAWAWVRAFAEAGSVGAIADWFAVTALFRHPLGLPIPHTAIIPRNKDEIGRALGAFVEQNFLTPENLARRFATVDAAGAAVRWLSSRRNSRRCARGICRLVPPMLDGLDDAAFRRLLDQAVLPQIERLEVAPLAGRLLEIMTLEGRHQALLDQGLRSLDGWLNENRTRIREKFSEASRYTSRIFDRYVVDRFVDGIAALLHEIAVDPEHEMRGRFDEATRSFILKLKESPEYATKGRDLLEEIIAHLRTESYYRSVWEDLRGSIVADIARPSSVIVANLAEALAATARIVLADDRLRARLDAWIRGAVETLLIRHRHEISGLIAEVVAAWDADEISRKVEGEIGRDLQYIRINGTLVGGAAGVLLHGLSLALSQ
jgi:uncharacterized membrane-anchored protein YjiN (DUF445 family)